ncbi:MAG TPA: S9 family peptidase [Thermoanaerobaculia bacterium]|jgi:dipeptidyl aminopeptidase/acylaminoacyl peptidase|nr:S9 family peptidase [Thermoanaerobaculia bacterium]
MTTPRHSLLCLALVLAFTASAQGQLTPERALDRRGISDLQLSPDGSRVAFTVSEPPKGEARNSDIWVLDLRTKESRRFATSPKEDRSPRWSPDGKRLAFLSNREERTQIFVMPVDGGEAVALTKGKMAVASFNWSPDGRRISFLAAEPKSEAEEKREKDKDDARVVDRDDKRTRLWIADAVSGEARQVTSAPWEVLEAHWAPHGDRLYVVANDKPGSDRWLDRLCTVTLADGAVYPIAAPKGPIGELRVSPDGKWLAYVGSPKDGPTPHDLIVQPVDGSASRNLTGGAIDRPIQSYAWRSDGSLIAEAAAGFGSVFYTVALDGKAASRDPLPVVPGDFALSSSGALAFVGQTTTAAPEVWLAAPGAKAQPLTTLNAAWKDVPLIAPEILKYRSFDGLEIEAALLRPPGLPAGTRAPLIVLVHGGPTGRWSDAFNPWSQLLASRGYAVLMPNVRGSTGYGHKLVEMNRADWGGGDFKDVMAGVDHLIQTGVADPDRLGIGGWSYGGYMSAWAITQTDRFKAAVVGAGMSDLATEFGTEDDSAYDEWFYGLPWENREKFQASSPMTFVQRAKTPALILQGENDATDPISQSQPLYRALKRLGVASDFVVYPRAGHGLREEKQILDSWRRIVAWFDLHVRGIHEEAKPAAPAAQPTSG